MDEQVGLAVEVLVDGRAGDPRTLGDAGEAGLAEPALDELVDRRGDETFTGRDRVVSFRRSPDTTSTGRCSFVVTGLQLHLGEVNVSSLIRQ